MQQIIKVDLWEGVKQLFKEILCFVFLGSFNNQINVFLSLSDLQLSLFINYIILVSFLFIESCGFGLIFLLLLRLNSIIHHGLIKVTETSWLCPFIKSFEPFLIIVFELDWTNFLDT